MLPSILEIAMQEGLKLDPHTTQSREVRTKCPFCNADALKANKYYLSLNTNDNVFKCWSCGESGGVLKFIALLQGKSQEEVKRDLGFGGKSKKPLHPAEKLTPSQLKLVGIVGPSWYQLKKQDYNLYQRTLSWVLQEWQCYVANEKQRCYRHFCILTKSAYRTDLVKQFADKTSLSFNSLMKEFAGYNQNKIKKPQWAKEAERQAKLWLIPADKKTS